MNSQSAAATNQSVPLDQLQGTALDQEPDLDGLWCPFFGWNLSVLGFLDMLANAFGFPLLSATTLTASQIENPGLAAGFIIFFQLFCILVGCLLLSRSPWRLWVHEISATARTNSADSPRQSATNRWWTEILPSSAPENSAHRGFYLIFLATVYVMITLLIGSLSLGGLALFLCATFVCLLVARGHVLGLVAARLLGDQASISGAVIAIAIHLSVFLFWTAPSGYVGDFLQASWSSEKFVWLRLYELYSLTILASWIYLLLGARLNNNIVLFVTAPLSKARVSYDLSAMVKFAGRKVTANLDMVLMREVIVLKRLSDHRYVTVSPEQPIWLSEDPHILLYTPALHSMHQRFPLVDRCGIFQAEGEVCAQPRGLGQTTIGMTMPSDAVEPLLGLLNSDAMHLELQRLSQETFDGFAANINEMGERLDVRFAQLEGQVDDVLFQVETGVQLPQSGVTPQNQSIAIGLSELSRKQDALTMLQSCRDQGNQMLDRWLDVISLKVSAVQLLQNRFNELFASRYLRGDQQASQLFQQLGISFNAFLTADPGTSGRGELMASRLNDRCRDVRDKVIDQISISQQRLMDVYVETLKLTHEHDKLALQNLFTMLPQLFPYFRNRPEHLMRFIEFAMRQIQGPVTFEKVQALLTNSATPTPTP